ncbi:MAG: hypothetical protein REI09_05175 [Candidatus Dactylopiibacterium sp.]|nr:hypothetical protein [Candidatus Dactylopiibacterium sp.]
MTYGIRARRVNGGGVQFDPTYCNLVARSAGSLAVTAWDGWSGARAATLSFDNPSGLAMVAYRASALTACMLVTSSGTTSSFKFISYDASTVDYWIFDVPQYGTRYYEAAYGMRVKRLDGSVAFDSRYRYMRVLDIVRTEAAAFSRSYGAGVVPAVIVGANSYRWLAQTDFPGDQWVFVRQQYGAIRTAGADVTGDTLIITATPFGNPNYPGGDYVEGPLEIPGNFKTLVDVASL